MGEAERMNLKKYRKKFSCGFIGPSIVSVFFSAWLSLCYLRVFANICEKIRAPGSTDQNAELMYC